MRVIDLTWIRFNYRRLILSLHVDDNFGKFDPAIPFLSHSRISTRLRGVQFDNGSNENCLDLNVIGRNGRNWRRTFFPQISRIAGYIIETTVVK